MLKIGHRGAAGYEPENTLRSFRKAIELGADMVECDLRLSKDRQIVIIHDRLVNRTTNGHGLVFRKTLSQLKNLDAGLGEKIPTLAEVLALVKGRCLINVEIKSRGIVRYLIKELKSLDFPLADLYISCNNLATLVYIKKIIPEVKMAWLFRATDTYLKETSWIFCMFIFFPFVKNFVIGKLKKNSIEAVNIHHLLATKRFIDRIHECNKMVCAWTVDADRKIRWLKEWQIDGIFTNYLDRL